MQKRLVNILNLIFFILLFVTPLFHTNLTYEQYEYPKMFLVYFLILFLFIIFGFFYEQKINFGTRWVFVYVLFAGISTFLANSPYNALFGYYSRQVDGFLSIFFFYILYLIMRNIKLLFEKKEWFLFLLLSQVPVIFAGFWQIGKVARVYSTFGQPNWYGAYLVCLLPLSIAYARDQKEKIFSYFWYSVAFANSVSIFFTGSISALIAFVFVSSIFAFKFVKAPIIIGFLSAIIIGTFFNFDYLSKKYSDVFTFSKDPTQYQISDPGLIRAGLWKGTWQLFLSSPKILLFGVGPENFAYEYPKFRAEELNYSSEWNFIMNKPHNYFLELLVEHGLIGFFFFMLILWEFFRKSDFFEKLFLIAFCVTSFFGWPSVFLWVMFWILMK